MRVYKKKIKNMAAITRLLDEAHVGRLATNGVDGYPRIKPLNFVYRDGRIYFHSARDGEKIEDITRDGRVSFEVDFPVAYVRADGNPCSASYRYRSVVARGRATIVENLPERVMALQCLMEKYQPGGGYGDFPEEKLEITAVVRIDIEDVTGKEDLRGISV
jgi:nitroimidazol reductase NimA-like FMN-containing flavoprotein (pyridoxamine 5'-phosphate oxidase superfamily)